MKTITAENNQTLFDIALQEMGSVEGVFELLSANPTLRLDNDIPPLTVLNVPETIINPQVVDYYSRNNIKPASGIGEQVIIETVEIHQILNQSLGTFEEIEFPVVEVARFSGILWVDVICDKELVADSVLFLISYDDGNGQFIGITESSIYLTGDDHLILSGYMTTRVKGSISINIEQNAMLREIIYTYEKHI